MDMAGQEAQGGSEDITEGPADMEGTMGALGARAGRGITAVLGKGSGREEGIGRRRKHLAY